MTVGLGCGGFGEMLSGDVAGYEKLGRRGTSTWG